MRAVTVFCSARSSIAPEIFRAAEDFARELVRRNLELVYGGGNVGLMNHFADSVLQAGGRVCGVIPEFFVGTGEIMHPRLTETKVVRDLFERKKWLMELGDAFAIFPGGYGTLDEAYEAMTWMMLGQLPPKPLVFVNIDGFWNTQIRAMRELHEHGMASSLVEPFLVADTVADFFSLLRLE